MSAARVTLLALVVGAVACGPETRVIPPVGEVLVIVDTDMPVPRIVSRLRVDVYAMDHTWYASRDTSRASAADWPTSFGLTLPDGARDGRAIVRLRAYPQGEERDYRGERFASRPVGGEPLDVPPAPPATNLPRLLLPDGANATPPTEPAPLVTIDRLLLVRVPAAGHVAAHVVLRGACVGTMADLAGERTCVDTEGARAPLVEEPTDASTALPAVSLAGTFDPADKCTAPRRAGSAAADGTPLFDEDVCVDGAMFLHGSNAGFGFGDADDVPRRVAILPPFRMDRYEVTVARWRDALARGFHPPAGPIPNEAPIPRDGASPNDTSACTWSKAPLARETFPLNCVGWDSARAFCRFDGGDLPSEAQWEYVALDAGRPYQTPFPWGGVPGVGPTCDEMVFARGPFPFDDQCNPGLIDCGPQPVDTLTAPGQDLSLGLGVAGLLGGVSELTMDTFASLSSNCWASQPLHAPSCDVPNAVTHTIRGGDWAASITSEFGARRLGLDDAYVSAEVGFRCVRPGT